MVLRNQNGVSPLNPIRGVYGVMNNPDQDTVLRAIEDARRILDEYIEPGPRDATLTVERLFVVLNRDDVVHALDRMNRRKMLRLVD
jgi:hypothetical protein